METKLETGEWLTPEEFRAMMGMNQTQIKNLLNNMNIPDCYVKRTGRSSHSHIIGFHVDLPSMIERYKTERLNKWIEANEKQKELKSASLEIEQPPDAIHVPDPEGKYPGFWLTPEQAIMLAKIRIHHRLHGGGASDSNCRIGILQVERGKCIRTR